MGPWSHGIWFGFSKRRIRWIYIILVIVGGLLFLFLLTATLLVRYKAHRASSLVERIQGLTLGAPLEQALAVARDFQASEQTRPCTRERCDLWFEVTHYEIANWVGDLEILNRLGLRPWRVSGTIQIANGKVEQTSISVLVHLHEHEWGDAGWQRLLNSRSGDELSGGSEEEMLSKQGYATRWHHLHVGDETGAGLETRLLPSAPDDIWREATQINLRCLTRVPGCTSTRDLTPVAVRTWEQRVRTGHDY
jgi:hypothetical protein